MALTTKEKHYPVLALGYNPALPPRTMGPEGPFIYRDALNLIEREGILRRRAALDSVIASLQVPYQLLTGTGNDSEVPVFISVIDSRSATGIDTYAVIVVTNRNIWVMPEFGSGYNLCTPTYTTGTFSATNGLTTITGAGGTLWQTRNITAGQLLKDNAAGKYYVISAVTGEAAITLASAYTGATGAGKAYTIVRTFPGSAAIDPAAVELSAVVFNEDLYVAGTYAGSADLGTRSPAVIRVSGIFKATQTTTYVTGQKALVSGLDIVADMDRIAGIEALQDGRLVVAGAQNISFYSSNLNTAVWTVSPGGQTPLTDIDGRIHALGHIGTVLTYHHSNGVVNGYPTGQADPPLRYQASPADAGVFAPRSLKRIGGREVGVTVRGSVIGFDLQNCVTVSGPIRSSLQAFTADELYLFHGWTDVDRNEYTIVHAPTATPSEAHAWTYQIDMDRWWPLRYAAPLTAVAEGLAKIDRLVGVASLDGTTESNIIYSLAEGTFADAVLYAGASNGGFYVVTDDLDFDNPRTLKVPKTILVWLAGISFTSETVKVSISRDQGLNWTAATSAVTLSGGAGFPETIKQFSFDPLLPGAATAWRFKLETTHANEVRAAYLRMTVSVLETGMVELSTLL